MFWIHYRFWEAIANSECLILIRLNKLMLVRKREKARSDYFKIVDIFSVPLNLQPLNLSLPKSEYQTSFAWFGVEFILIY